MIKKLSFILFLLITSNACAGISVCFDEQNKIVKHRLRRGRMNCGTNTLIYLQNENPNYVNTSNLFHSVNKKFLKISSNTVIEMSQAEKDALIASEAQAQADEETAGLATRDDNLVKDRSNINLPKAFNAIDNIGSLADAKVFLKKLVRYLADTRARP